MSKKANGRVSPPEMSKKANPMWQGGLTPRNVEKHEHNVIERGSPHRNAKSTWQWGCPHPETVNVSDREVPHPNTSKNANRMWQGGLPTPKRRKFRSQHFGMHKSIPTHHKTRNRRDREGFPTPDIRKCEIDVKEWVNLVIESPVRSGYLMPKGPNQDPNWLGLWSKPKIT